MSNGWIAVDLDGTFAHYTSGDGIESIGAPIQAMLNRILRWLHEGRDVRIFTARVGQGTVHEISEQRRMIEAYCQHHIGRKLPVTCIKDMHMDEIWDDRAVAVEPNTGKQLSPSRRGLGDSDVVKALHGPLGFTGK